MTVHERVFPVDEHHNDKKETRNHHKAWSGEGGGAAVKSVAKRVRLVKTGTLSSLGGCGASSPWNVARGLATRGSQ